MKLINILFFILFLPSLCSAAYINISKNAEGWTVFTPSADSDVVYISESGNDETCKSYRTSDAAMGTNPFQPAEAILPCKTYATAYSLTNDNSPDWILFKRGEIFHDIVGDNIRNGKSVTEPFLVSSYGISGTSPLIKTGTSTAIALSGGGQYIALMGLDFYAHTRDPASADYVDSTGGYGIGCTLGSGKSLQGLLIEGCKFRFYASNVIQQYLGDFVGDLIIRRSTISDNYRTDAHSQGFFTNHVDGMILEENFFYHNGWLIQNKTGNQSDTSEGQATHFNHNIYFAAPKNMVFRGNSFIEGSSGGIKFTNGYNPGDADNNVIDNNLIVGGTLGICIYILF